MMETWLTLTVIVAALVVGYVFGARQAVARISVPELAQLWERHLVAEMRRDLRADTPEEAYRSGLRDMARALVIGDPPPPTERN